MNPSIILVYFGKDQDPGVSTVILEDDDHLVHIFRCERLDKCLLIFQREAHQSVDLVDV